MSTNLGTAYVSVMPSMQGFGKAVESGMAGIDTSAAGEAMGSKAATGFAGGMAKGGAVMGAVSALATKALDAVASSTDRAVARVDTMANFPKIMANLGISADAAQQSIDALSTGLDGLPTTLDAGARAVQRFTSYNGDIMRSTDMFLAVNDAIMAGGTSAAMQATALEQLTQSYTKGKMDMMEWRTIQQTMPAQLKQIAEAMGLTTEQLGAGLRQAEKDAAYLRDISMDEFINEIMRLDKEGGEGFASFEEQARTATTGIETALTNLNTRISRGVAEMIDAVGQENISGAINTLSSGIVGIGRDLGQDLKVATEFVKEHEEELKTLADTLMDIAPMAVRAWGAFQLFKGGKALFKGVGDGVMGLVGGFGKLTDIGGKVWEAGDRLDVAGRRGGKALKGLGNAAMDAGLLIGSMTGGAVALAGGLAVGIGALYAYNQALGDAAYQENYFTEEEQAVIDGAHTLADSYNQLAEARERQVGSIGREYDRARQLIDVYNSLVDENGNVIEGKEYLADVTLNRLAEAMGVERSYIDGLIDEYGKLGSAAEESAERRKAAKLLEAMEPAYNEASANFDAAVQKQLESLEVYNKAVDDSAEANRGWSDTQQDMLDMFGSAPEAMSGFYQAQIETARAIDAANDRVRESKRAYDDATDTLNNYKNDLANFEGFSAAFDSGDAAAIEEWCARVQNSVITAEGGTRESLEAQVRTFQESYDRIAEAVANGDTSLEGSLASVGAALAASKDELARYNAIELKDKVAKAGIDDGALVIAQDHVYEWNGSELVDLGAVADVEDSGVLDATDHILVYNGTDLVDKDGKVATHVDTSAWDSWEPQQKNAWVATRVNAITSFFGAAQGGMFDLHASGGFITNGPTVLGADRNGVVHIAGEDGREWVRKHADGTTSILPIENRKYLAPYANMLASMINSGGPQTVNNYSITLDYKAGDDAATMARDLGRIMRASAMMGG